MRYFMSKIVLGIDISKAKFDVAHLKKEGDKLKYKHKKFDNKEVGFKELVNWLVQQEAEDIHICMEATGFYGEALATYLFDVGYSVSVINPAQIKAFGQSELSRTKTDKADAKLIARFCLAIDPPTWQPTPKNIRELQALVRRLEALQGMLQQEKNRLEGAFDSIRPSIFAVIAKLEEEIESVKKKIKDHIDRNPDLRDKKLLLESIPGVGETTIAQVLAFLSVEQFENARKAAAFVGLNPRQYESGSSVRGKTRLSKMGNSNLRKAFYLPAITARRFNPVIKAFCKRLEEAGKPKMLIIGAAMRKLVHMIYGVLKSGMPFNAKLAIQ